MWLLYSQFLYVVNILFQLKNFFAIKCWNELWKQNLLLLCYWFLKESAREEVLVKTVKAAYVEPHPVCFHDTSAKKGDLTWWIL